MSKIHQKYTNFECASEKIGSLLDAIWYGRNECAAGTFRNSLCCVFLFFVDEVLFLFFISSSALFLRLRLKYCSLFLLRGSKCRLFVSSVYLRRLIVEQVVLDRAIHSCNKTGISETKNIEKCSFAHKNQLIVAISFWLEHFLRQAGALRRSRECWLPPYETCNFRMFKYHRRHFKLQRMRCRVKKKNRHQKLARFRTN